MLDLLQCLILRFLLLPTFMALALNWPDGRIYAILLLSCCMGRMAASAIAEGPNRLISLTRA